MNKGEALNDEINLCKKCNTMKHVDESGLCGRCRPSISDELDEAEAKAIADMKELFRKRGIPMKIDKPTPTMRGRLMKLFDRNQYMMFEKIYTDDGSDMIKMNEIAIKRVFNKMRSQLRSENDIKKGKE